MKTNFLNHIQLINYNYNQKTENKMIQFYTHEIDLLSICGGIPINYPNSYLLDISYEKNQFELSLDTPEHTVERTLNIPKNFIRNNLMVVYSTRNGIGKCIFINQIIQARKLGITVFFVSAARSSVFNGYYTWARMGYDFVHQHEIDNFNDLMKSNNRIETTLFDLMKTPNGRSFWKKNGFWWEGQFMIQPGSKNIIAFNTYLSQTGISLSL